MLVRMAAVASLLASGAAIAAPADPADPDAAPMAKTAPAHEPAGGKGKPAKGGAMSLEMCSTKGLSNEERQACCASYPKNLKCSTPVPPPGG